MDQRLGLVDRAVFIFGEGGFMTGALLALFWALVAAMGAAAAVAFIKGMGGLS